MNNSDAISDRYNLVRKSNDLIQKSRFDLSLLQQKILVYLISQIKPEDTELKLYDFNIASFCKVCGIDETSGKNYSNIKKAIKDLADRSIWIDLDNNTETLIRWIERPYIEKRSGIVRIKLDELMKPFLLDLKKNYYSYEAIWMYYFESKYSQRLYEYIDSIHYRKLFNYKKLVPIDDLKRAMGAENFSTWQHFREKALDIAIDEINRLSDKIVIYTPIKTGKAITDIVIDVSTKNEVDIVRTKLQIQEEFSEEDVAIFEKEMGL